MKKLYIQPTLKIGSMATLGMIAASKWTETDDDFTETNGEGYDVTTDVTEGSGDGSDFGSKHRGFYEGF